MCYTNFKEQKPKQVTGYKVVIRDGNDFFSISTLVKYQIGKVPELPTKSEVYTKKYELGQKGLRFRTLRKVYISENNLVSNYRPDYKGSALFENLEDCENLLWYPGSDNCIVKITGNLIGIARYTMDEPLFIIDEITKIEVI